GLSVSGCAGWGFGMDIELGDAVAGVRQELLDAAARGAGRAVGFVVGPIELEFAVELRADVKVKAGFKAWVVSADVEAGVARGRTHKVRVTLTPKNADGTDVLIAGEAGAGFGPGDVSGHLGR
ncbi:MAG: trypco2 family protein, partial [Sciscionella sp.]